MSEAIPEPHFWERQPSEPNRWFARFEAYRLAGPGRSLLGSVNAERLCRRAVKTHSIPHAWAEQARRWRWRERAEAWDEHQRQLARAAHAQAVEEMNHRHVQQAKALQAKGLERLRSCGSEELALRDVVRFVVEASKLERTALGQPEIIQEQRLRGGNGGAVVFTLEDAVRADQEMERWQHDHVQPQPSPELPHGNSQMP
jgi:hypothetical protein